MVINSNSLKLVISKIIHYIIFKHQFNNYFFCKNNYIRLIYKMRNSVPVFGNSVNGAVVSGSAVVGGGAVEIGAVDSGTVLPPFFLEDANVTNAVNISLNNAFKIAQHFAINMCKLEQSSLNNSNINKAVLNAIFNYPDIGIYNIVKKNKKELGTFISNVINSACIPATLSALEPTLCVNPDYTNDYNKNNVIVKALANVITIDAIIISTLNVISDLKVNPTTIKINNNSRELTKIDSTIINGAATILAVFYDAVFEINIKNYPGSPLTWETTGNAVTVPVSAQEIIDNLFIPLQQVINYIKENTDITIQQILNKILSNKIDNTSFYNDDINLKTFRGDVEKYLNDMDFNYELVIVLLFIFLYYTKTTIVPVVNNTGSIGILDDGTGNVVIGPGSISISHLIKAGSVEKGYHDTVRDQLLKSVSGLTASQILNVTETLSGVKQFDIEDWGTIAGACQEGNLDLGFLDAAGNVIAMITAGGKEYVNAINTDGSAEWMRIPFKTTTTTVEQPAQPVFEPPKITAERLSGISKAAINPFAGLQFMTTYVPYQAYEVPTVSPTGDLQFRSSIGYAGIRADLPETSFQIVAGQKIQPF